MNERKYLVTICEGNVCDYFEGDVNGITYKNLSEKEMKKIVDIALKQNFSIIIA